MAARTPPRKRTRGQIEALPSGSLRVRLYAGLDPLTKKRHYLHEVVPAGPQAARRAESVLARFITLVDERRNPPTSATIDQLMDRYFDPRYNALNIEETTLIGYRASDRNHIRPLLGHLKVAGLQDAAILDSFKAELFRCRAHCDGRRYIEHRTKRPHECDHRCAVHTCRPLGASTIRSVFAVLAGALTCAKRWRWISTNPLHDFKLPTPPAPAPTPPTANQAALLLNQAWKDDPDWGMFLWMKARTGARRGEMCAMKLSLLDLDARSQGVHTSIAQSGRTIWEKATKTHQQRSIALDEADVTLLRAYLGQRRHKAAELGLALHPNGRLFSPSPDHSEWLKPDLVSRRFKRLATRLNMPHLSIKGWRAFAATELIAAGVNVRTVGGRLGHGGGGVTTLKVYAAALAEADQRAAELTGPRIPVAPEWLERLTETHHNPAVPDEPSQPYERIAADLAGAIRAGLLSSGDKLPAMKTLAERYGVAVSTVHRAINLLKRDDLVHASRGIAATVR